MELKRTQETNRQNEASKLPETRENAGRSLLVSFVSNWLEDRVKIFPDKIRPSEVRQ